MNKYLNILEDLVLLGGQIVFHKALLSTAVPEMQDEVAEKAHMGMFDLDGGAEAICVAGYVVGKDDGSEEKYCFIDYQMFLTLAETRKPRRSARICSLERLPLGYVLDRHRCTFRVRDIETFHILQSSKIGL